MDSFPIAIEMLLENIKEYFVYPDFLDKSIQCKTLCEENFTVLFFE